MSAGDTDRVGELLYGSHASLRDDYAVSCAELDWLVADAATRPYIRGARMTGGGFGGCAIALVERRAIDQYLAEVGPAYRAACGIELVAFAAEIDGGARVDWRG